MFLLEKTRGICYIEKSMFIYFIHAYMYDLEEGNAYDGANIMEGHEECRVIVVWASLEGCVVCYAVSVHAPYSN